MIYVLSLIPFVIGSFMDLKEKKSAFYYWYVLLTFMFLVCFWGMRYYTGSDWFGYLSYYDSANKGSTYGIGFKILNILSEKLFHSYYPVQFFSAFILLLGVYRLVFRHSRYPFLCIVLFCVWYFELFYQIRQAYALGIVLLNFDCFATKKHWRFLGSILVATTFHSTILIMLLLYAGKFRIPKKIKLLVLFCCAVLILYPTYVYSLYCKMVNTMANMTMLPANIIGRLVGYKSPIWWDASQGSSANIVFRLLLVFLTTITSTENDTEDIQIVSDIAVVCIIFSALGVLSLRLASYFGILMIMYIVTIFEKAPLSKKNVQIIIFLWYISSLLIMWFRSYTNSAISDLTHRPGTYSTVPYYNVLFHPAEAKFRKDWIEP